jgi:hypothetical protein
MPVSQLELDETEGSDLGLAALGSDLGMTASGTTSSKRSREPSDDSEEIDVSEVHVPERPEKSARTSAYKSGNGSGRSTPAVDLELLHVKRVGIPRPRKDRTATLPAYASGDDATRSFEQMNLNWESNSNRQASSRPGSSRSRQSSRR